MQRLIGIAVLVAALSSAAAAQEPQKLTEQEKAKIREQVQALKDSKLKEAEVQNKYTKEDALRQGQAIDQKLEKADKIIDKAVDNYSSRYGTDYARSAGNAKKQELKERADAEKQRIANEAKKRGATQNDSAKKTTNDIDQAVEGLKSQVSKQGKYGLTPKGSSIYIRNYGGKSSK